jgi:hypothetical protein
MNAAELLGETQVLQGSDELAARRSLRAQIAKLERELSDAFVTAYADGVAPAALRQPGIRFTHPRMLGLEELELQRDGLVERLHDLRVTLTAHADELERGRILLEDILAAPEQYPFAQLRLRETGARNCGVYQVRPRLGLIGMLRGWWHVKLSSGCPLPGGRGLEPRPV